MGKDREESLAVHLDTVGNSWNSVREKKEMNKNTPSSSQHGLELRYTDGQTDGQVDRQTDKQAN